MTEAVLEVVLEKLSSLIGKELGLFLGFDRDMKKLCSMFTAIKATLQDAAEKQLSNKAIKDWSRKLKDATYEMDDILEECAYEALGLEYQGGKSGQSHKVRSCLSSFHPMHIVFRYKIAKRMKRISERLDEIAEERQKFHLTEMTPKRSGVTERHQTSSIITEQQVYGRKEDTKKILDFLMAGASHSKNLSVYPIVGLGGIGKTTLAQLIFNHEMVVNMFEPRIWLSVSEDFSLKRMTKAIIEAISSQVCENLDLELLQRKLKDLLRGKKYLLVLDDVWDNILDNWQKLEGVLASGAKGASILVTTRLPKVAAIMGTMPPHEVAMLSEDDSWELFKNQAFGSNEEEQVELVVIGKEIIKKCRGVPLVAKAIGGHLRFKRKENEWLYVKESNLWSLPHNENSIMSALRLSYMDLPLKLKQCFAYCAIFPKDKIIIKQCLIELWMVNGFISSNEILDAEDAGDGVWNELYWRSFFQDIVIDEFGKVTSFKMHDLVHDLAQSVAEDVCCITKDNLATTFSERIYHISNLIGEAINPIQLHKVKYLRTYIGWYNTSQLCSHIFKCYSLRVLWLGQREEVLSSIGELKHLRYLNLCGGRFITLPESLCRLWNLQILKLDHCYQLEKLPNNLIRLKALQHLSLNNCWKLSTLPPQTGKLTSLRNLSTYYVGNKRGFLLEELGPLKLKGSLHIKHLGKVKSVKDAKEANMSRKQLSWLSLSWDTNEESESQENTIEILEALQPDTQQLQTLSVLGYKGAYFPQWMSSSLSLKKLIIVGCLKFNMSAGSKCLTCLSHLTIHDCTEVEGLLEAFQHMTALKELELSDLPNLESLPDCFENLLFLHKMTIANCPKLKCLPLSLNLSSIESLTIEDCPELKKQFKNETR